MLSNKRFSPHATRHLLTLCLWLVALAMIGCPIACGGHGGTSDNSGISTPQQFGRATISVTFPKPSRLIPSAAQSIVVAIRSGNRVVSSKTLVRPSTGGTVTATFDSLPVGDCIATATAYPNTDGSGTAQAAASTPLTITKGLVTPFAVTMESTITQLVITPADTSLGIGESRALAATPQDASGATVLVSPATLSWQSSNPSVATVTADGVLSGVTLGSAVITATETESGKSATATITVTAAPPSPSPSPSPSGPPPGAHQPTFVLTNSYPLSSQSFSNMIATDIDGDGNVDIIYDDATYYGIGNGAFERPVAFPDGELGDVADVDNDGLLDVITYNILEIQFHKNMGGRSFSAPIKLSLPLGSGSASTFPPVAVSVPNQPNKVIALNLHRDGTSQTRIIQLMGQTLKEIARYTAPTGVDLGAIHSADVTKDGIADMVMVANFNNNTYGFYTLQGQPDGTFTPLSQPTIAGYDFTTADFNGDGKIDLAFSGLGFTGSAGTSINLFTNQYPSDFSGPVSSGTGVATASIKYADFDKDGLNDIVLAHAFGASTKNEVVVMWNRGGSFTPINIPLDPSIGYPELVATGDFNHDGKPDIAVINQYRTPSAFQDQLSILINTTH